MKTCNSCGSTIAEYAIECWNCHASAVETTTLNKLPDSSNKNSKPNLTGNDTQFHENSIRSINNPPKITGYPPINDNNSAGWSSTTSQSPSSTPNGLNFAMPTDKIVAGPPQYQSDELNQSTPLLQNPTNIKNPKPITSITAVILSIIANILLILITVFLNLKILAGNYAIVSNENVTVLFYIALAVFSLITSISLLFSSKVGRYVSIVTNFSYGIYFLLFSLNHLLYLPMVSFNLGAACLLTFGKQEKSSPNGIPSVNESIPNSIKAIKLLAITIPTLLIASVALTYLNIYGGISHLFYFSSVTSLLNTIVTCLIATIFAIMIIVFYFLLKRGRNFCWILILPAVPLITVLNFLFYPPSIYRSASSFYSTFQPFVPEGYQSIIHFRILHFSTNYSNSNGLFLIAMLMSLGIVFLIKVPAESKAFFLQKAQSRMVLRAHRYQQMNYVPENTYNYYGQYSNQVPPVPNSQSFNSNLQEGPYRGNPNINPE